MGSLLQRTELLVKSHRDISLQITLRKQCEEDILFFFNWFVFTFDPRLTIAQSKIPFNLYPAQEWVLKELYSRIDLQKDVAVEKSRDLGLSWLVSGIFVWIWLFKPSWNLLCGSRTVDEVDVIGDMSTLFEKMRFIIRHLPPWLRPNTYDAKKHATYLKIVNPHNGNTITGKASGPNFSISGRYKAIFMDELSVWTFADSAWKTTSRSTNCRIVVATPRGPHSLHGRLMLNKDNERFIWPGRAHMLEKKRIECLQTLEEEGMGLR